MGKPGRVVQTPHGREKRAEDEAHGVNEEKFLCCRSAIRASIANGAGDFGFATGAEMTSGAICHTLESCST